MLWLIASVLSPFFVDCTPEVRTTYQSLGKIVEDRPMQITNLRAGWDSGMFGRFGVRNWDVSSLTDRRADVHRHCLYHTEFGPTWQYDLEIVNRWVLKTDVTYSWTLYRGFENEAANKTYQWAQIDQSLENPYVVPYYRLRRCFVGNDYFYFKIGLRRKFAVWKSLYVTPSVFIEGGNARNFMRVIGPNVNGGGWSTGVSSISFRLETGWRFNEMFTVFLYVEQYEVVGGDARDSNAVSPYRCAHNDWTHGGVGLRMSF